jgi:transcriptional regulator with XRE-family HTH domain
LLGVTAESIANWERGRRNPGIRHVAAVIQYLGYDPIPEGDSPADRLRAWRRRTGLRQREVATRLGLDEGTVVEFKLGRRWVSIRFAEVVRRLLSAENQGAEQ